LTNPAFLLADAARNIGRVFENDFDSDQMTPSPIATCSSHLGCSSGGGLLTCSPV